MVALRFRLLLGLFSICFGCRQGSSVVRVDVTDMTVPLPLTKCVDFVLEAT